MTILIPSYEPDERLIMLVQELKNNHNFNIVVVDDGSGEIYNSYFEKLKEMGCIILTHEVNKGKGCALKTGFDYIFHNSNETEGVITADADGQHLVKDILLIVAQLPFESRKIVLGVRKFIGSVPIKSVVGNTISRAVFKLASGYQLIDTQTGLRGFPVDMLAWLLNVEGERFEYEMNMLLEASTMGFELVKINIATVYIKGNKSTHFRAIQDSILVFLPFLKFCMSGLSAAVVDYVLLFVFQDLTKNLFISVVAARAVSSGVNFAINSTHTFKKKPEHHKSKSEAVKYYILVCALLMLNYFILSFLWNEVKIPLFWSKVLTELFLFTFSYYIQRFFVFKKRYQT